MERVKRGEVDVMIGPRSALFTPFSNLGLIVIDEEHERTYKSEQVPRYHARETAEERAQMEGASLVLGSATPSLEAFYRCKTGEVPAAAASRPGGRAESSQGVCGGYAGRIEERESFHLKRRVEGTDGGPA